MVKVIKKSFVVIGKEGSTLDGEGFIQKLWDDANSHFGEVAHLAKKDANGGIVGIWGAMSDISRSFKPWEDGFSKGLYLAGVECVDNAEAPDGWTKWIIPDYEYIVVENHKGVFEETIGQMNEDGISLVGAVHDYTDPATGKGYLYFPCLLYTSPSPRFRIYFRTVIRFRRNYLSSYDGRVYHLLSWQDCRRYL